MAAVATPPTTTLMPMTNAPLHLSGEERKPDKHTDTRQEKKPEEQQEAPTKTVSLWEHLQRARANRRPMTGEDASWMAKRKIWIERVKKVRDIELPDQPWFDLLEVGFYLNCDKQTIKRMIDKNEIKGEKRGRSWYISHRNLTAYLTKLHKKAEQLRAEGAL